MCGKSFRRRDQLRRHLKIHVRKDGLSEVGARKALGGKKGEEMSETGSQLLSPSPSVPPGGTGMEIEFNEEGRMGMGMDMEIDGGSMMVCYPPAFLSSQCANNTRPRSNQWQPNLTGP